MPGANPPTPAPGVPKPTSQFENNILHVGETRSCLHASSYSALYAHPLVQQCNIMPRHANQHAFSAQPHSSSAVISTRDRNFIQPSSRTASLLPSFLPITALHRTSPEAFQSKKMRMKYNHGFGKATPDYPSAIRLTDLAQHDEAEHPSFISSHPEPQCGPPPYTSTAGPSEKLFQAPKRQKPDWEKWEQPDQRTSPDQTRTPGLGGMHGGGHRGWDSRRRELQRPDAFTKAQRARQESGDNPCEITVNVDLPVRYANRSRYEATGAHGVAPWRLVHPYSVVSWGPMVDTLSGLRYCKVTPEAAYHGLPPPAPATLPPYLDFPLTRQEAASLRGRDFPRSSPHHSRRPRPGRPLHSGFPAPGVPAVSPRGEMGTTARITHLCP